LARAEEYSLRALHIREKLAPGSLVHARSFFNLGVLAMRQGDPAKAAQYHRQGLEIREKLSAESELHADSLFGVGSALRAMGEPAESAKLFARALDMVERRAARLDGPEETRSRLRSQYADDYRDYVQLLVTQQQPEQAFNA